MTNSIKIVISAPSGAGKTTLITRLVKEVRGLEFSISTTTRSSRRGEVDGKSYYFISKDEFRKKINESAFVEWAMVHGNYYGTSKKEIDRITSDGNIPIFDVDVQGSHSLRDKLDNAVFILIVPPSIAELEKRLRLRNTDSESVIQLRLRNAVGELKHYDNFDYIVVNDDLERALDDLKSIIIAEQRRTDRNLELIKRLQEEHIDNTP